MMGLGFGSAVSVRSCLAKVFAQVPILKLALKYGRLGKDFHKAPPYILSGDMEHSFTIASHDHNISYY